jgi:predicted DsbA family dithiol-disulfide isomerase
VRHGWCYNAAVRLRRLQAEFGARVRLRLRSFILRPEERSNAAYLK